jgi:hypothetical protein
MLGLLHFLITVSSVPGSLRGNQLDEPSLSPRCAVSKVLSPAQFLFYQATGVLFLEVNSRVSTNTSAPDTESSSVCTAVRGTFH